MLAGRLVSIVEWARAFHDTAALPIGLFGASTGGGAALMAAADRPALISAVVSRGGRPDLAGEALPRVQAPTLLIVGSRDTPASFGGATRLCAYYRLIFCARMRS